MRLEAVWRGAGSSRTVRGTVRERRRALSRCNPQDARSKTYLGRHLWALSVELTLPGPKSDSPEDIRAFYRPLASLAREHGCAVVVILHLNKDRSRNVRHRVMGGAAWINVPRAALIIGTPGGDDPAETPERVVAVLKANLLAGKVPDSLGFSLSPGAADPSVAVIEWTGERPDVRADDLTGSIDEDERGERDDCAQSIEDMLAKGPRGRGRRRRRRPSSARADIAPGRSAALGLRSA